MTDQPANNGTSEVYKQQVSLSLPETRENRRWLPPTSPFQPGLGTLSKVPPEIRSQIWQELFTHSELSILRASKQLHEEAEEDLYRNQSLTFRLDDTWDPTALGVKSSTTHYTKFNDVYAWRDLQNVNLSRFRSIELDIETPKNDRTSLERFEKLVKGVERFVQCLQAWQTWRIRSDLIPRLPAIEVTVRLHHGTKVYRSRGSGNRWWELSALSIVLILGPLYDIQDAEDATIDIRFKTRHGQKTIEQFSRLARTLMKRRFSVWRSSYSFKALLERRDIFWACGESQELTQRTLGAKDGAMPSPSVQKTVKRKIMMFKTVEFCIYGVVSLFSFWLTKQYVMLLITSEA
ncbi:MAG: hypothetical protein L6R40_008272 [Gallowayella cf. fulva]|nr:MAG: hypothetical protein L6R40_008272 [Xanthomendoza cf. fulva]